MPLLVFGHYTIENKVGLFDKIECKRNLNFIILILIVKLKKVAPIQRQIGYTNTQTLITNTFMQIFFCKHIPTYTKIIGMPRTGRFLPKDASLDMTVGRLQKRPCSQIAVQ
jgi:hypothetical protein